MSYKSPKWNDGSAPPLSAENMQALTDAVQEQGETLAAMCNPNMLDNWYWGNPVNQRGQTSYTGAGYGIDRWKIQNDTNLTVGDGFCTLNGSWDIRQILENLPKATYTASILFKNSTANALQILFGRKTGGDESVAISHDASGVLAGTISNIDLSNFIISLSGSGSVDIIAVKLELGSVQTLAHQENNAWVLNEIPKFGDQLAECQRFYYQVHYGRYQTINVAYEDTSYAFTMLPLPVAMRIDNPVLTQSKPIVLGTSEKIMAAAEAKGCMARLGVNYTGISNPPGGVYSYCADPEGVTFTLSADL
nr:MAG TPA: hypothetical protein [Bacteriophage sp.]